jgi:hypothetical protein
MTKGTRSVLGSEWVIVARDSIETGFTSIDRAHPIDIPKTTPMKPMIDQRKACLVMIAVSSEIK